MRPFISILIPAYNAELWVADAIQSAVCQTWAHKEIIVVDDGSTDRTAEIAKQFGSKIKLVSTRTAVCARRSTLPTAYARETTSRNWMQTTSAAGQDRAAVSSDSAGRQQKAPPFLPVGLFLL